MKGNNYSIPKGAPVFKPGMDFDYIYKSFTSREQEQEEFRYDHNENLESKNPNIIPLKALGLDPDSTKDQVKAKYRKLAKENHPDRFEHLDSEAAIEAAEERFLQIKNAYDAIIQESLPEAKTDQE